MTSLLSNLTHDYCELQEVETEQYYNFFLPELKEQGYDGFFSPKSRARTMSESYRKHVDGCAVFYRTEKYVPTILLTAHKLCFVALVGRTCLCEYKNHYIESFPRQLKEQYYSNGSVHQNVHLVGASIGHVRLKTFSHRLLQMWQHSFY